MEHQLCDQMKEVQNTYKSLSSEVTSFKFDYLVNQCKPEQRMQALGLMTLAIGVVSRKGLNSSILQTLRNMYIGYYSAGLFMAPEIYNKKLFLYKY